MLLRESPPTGRGGVGLVLGTVDNGAPSWSDSSCGRGGRGVTSTVESGSMPVPAAQRPAEPEQQEQGARVGRGHGVPHHAGRVGAAPSDPRRLTRHRHGDHHDRRAARLGPDHHPSGHGSGTGCDAAPGGVRRTPAPPTGIRARHGRAARLELRTVDPAAVCAAAQTAGDDVTVVDLGAELTAAARSGLLGWADRLVFVRSDSGKAAPGQAIPGAISVDALIAAGHKALAQDAVTVSVAHAPPASPSEPAPCLSVDGHGRAVVHPVRCPPRYGWRPRPRPAVPLDRRGGPPARRARHRVVAPRPPSKFPVVAARARPPRPAFRLPGCPDG